MRGLVVKGIGGFYFVETEEGLFRAKARGKFKKDKSIIFVGDEVELVISDKEDDDSWITDIYPRKNCFKRPPISNVDNLVVVFSVTNPEPNLRVIDKLLVMAERNDVRPIICINKEDLDDGESLARYKEIYQGIYPVCVTDALTGDGFGELDDLIRGGKTALAGPSGVGKSTITNHLVPDAEMETGSLNLKTQRGRHTTRHVEIFRHDSGFLYDTPGFTSLDVDGVTESELSSYFPEMRGINADCRFLDCMHINEPDCAVLEAVRDGRISESRYNSYLEILNEIKERKRKYE